MLSVVIPSYKDPLLIQTIFSLLENSEGEIEIIPVLDGYTQEIPSNNRVHPIYLKKNGGMKNAINTGMKMARGDYVMRLDEHCMFGQGYDTILTSQMEDNWVVSPRRYFLDPTEWKVMDLEPVDCEKLVIDKKLNKFAGVRWTSRAKELKDEPIIESMMVQGSCVVMKKSWWDEVVKELSNEFGDHYGDQMEIVMKTWQAGGKLMINKNTWFAHKHRSFDRTHNYPRKKAVPGWKALLDTYGEYYNDTIKPQWGI